jgi:hypothetical protein
MLIDNDMEKTNNEFLTSSDKPTLSTIQVNTKGRLVYSEQTWNKVFRQMVKDLPIMCWHILLGMVMLFSISAWALAHRAETVTQYAEVLIYFFMLFVSALVTFSMIAISYYIAKSK